MPSPSPVPASRHLPAWALGPFNRPAGAKPVISPDAASSFRCPMRGRDIRWESLHTFNPAAVVRDGRVHLLYRAEDDTGAMEIGAHTSRLGLATSADGLSFMRRPAPVLFPAADGQREHEWDGGCEDPRLAEIEGGLYVLTYTQWNRRIPRLAVATSRDLVTWDKHGPAFDVAAWADLASKSGSIVHRIAGDRLVATRIDGRYWMYWGEGTVHAAHSEDLLRWTPVVDAAGRLQPLLPPRPGKFDSGLAEGGPQAILTDAGIVLLYNAKNAADGTRDPGTAPGAYAGGQALFDGQSPTRLLERMDEPFMRPELPWEASGQYAAGTTFIEGLVLHQGKWLLYYGCADSHVGVVIADR